VDGPGDGNPNFAGSSADGSRVFFTTPEQLVSADTDSSVDIYERFDGNTTIVSTGPNGGNGQFVEPDVSFLAASPDGRRVFFGTAESLVSSDADAGKGCTDEGFEIPCYDVYERFGGTTTLVSTGPASHSDGLHAVFEDISRDGTRVLFRTAEVLTSDDHDTVPDDYVAGIASTTGYARPKGATPIQASLVPAYEQCASPNRQHGPPLGFGSCNPPLPVSQYLTLGTADSNGQSTRFIGSVRFVALPDNPATSADEADVRVEVVASDVRSSPSLADYTGELSAAVSIRITDRDSSPGGPAPSTVQETPFSVAVPCTSNADPMVGSACSVTTSADTLVPGMVRRAQRTIWELGQIKVYDGGSDGLASTGGNTLFAVQGVFVP
jgi:hypothetical protein